MGAWGAGGFENDTALDFASTVESVADVARGLGEQPLPATIDADRACEIIAAAECVAAMLGRPSDDMPETLLNTLKKLGKPDTALLEHAREHVSAVIGRSELGELWAESDDPSAFNMAMTGLIDRLNPDIKPPMGRGKKKPVFNASPCAFCNQPMGEDELSMFDITVNLGNDLPMRLGKWAHITCLNKSLHPKHIVQVWKTDPDETGQDAASTAKPVRPQKKK